MKGVALIVFCASICGIALARPGEEYTTKYDDIDLDEILHNDRLFTSYYNCLMDLGPCSADGAELKSVIPDAMQNNCAKCSEKQKEGAKKVAKFIRDNKPDWAKAMQEKYDPTGEFSKTHEGEAR